MLNSKIKNSLKAAFVCFTFLLAALNCCFVCSASAYLPDHPLASDIIFDGRRLSCSKTLPLIGKTLYKFLPNKNIPNDTHTLIILPLGEELKEENRQHMQFITEEEFFLGQWLDPSDFSLNNAIRFENRLLNFYINYPAVGITAYFFFPGKNEPDDYSLVITLPQNIELKEENRSHMKFMDSKKFFISMKKWLDFQIMEDFSKESEIESTPASKYACQPEDQGPPASRYGDRCPLSCNIF